MKRREMSMRRDVFKIAAVLVVTIAFAGSGCSSSNGSGIPEITKVLVMSPQYDFGRVAEVFPLNMQGFEFSSWDIADSTPTHEELHDFDVVLLFANSSSNNDSNVANVLHEYVTDGGNLVLASFYYYYRGNGYWGKLESIEPVIGTLGSNSSFFDTTVINVNHPIMNGVDTLINYYHPTGYSVRSGAELVASYDSGNWLAAYNKPGGRIVSINAFPAEFDYQFAPHIEFFRLWENALLYAAWGQTSDRAADSGEPVVPDGGGGEAKVHSQSAASK